MDEHAINEEIMTHIQKKFDLKTSRSIRIDNKWNNGVLNVTVLRMPRDFGSAAFSLHLFPGCCKYCVLSGMVTRRRFRGIKLAPLMLNLAYHLAMSSLGSSTMIATCAYSINDKMVEILRRCGWEEAHSGLNPTSGRNVVMFYKNLSEQREDGETYICDDLFI